MGWRDKFPVIAHLNALTRSDHRSSTVQYFETEYGPEGDGEGGNREYELGDLCATWDPSKPVAPPWSDADDPSPWDALDASEWKTHCQNDLPEDVRADLEDWIKEAIKKRGQIIYRYKRIKTPKAGWAATRTVMGAKKWKVVVTGPGF